MKTSREEYVVLYKYTNLCRNQCYFNQLVEVMDKISAGKVTMNLKVHVLLPRGFFLFVLNHALIILHKDNAILWTDNSSFHFRVLLSGGIFFNCKMTMLQRHKSEHIIYWIFHTNQSVLLKIFLKTIFWSLNSFYKNFNMVKTALLAILLQYCYINKIDDNNSR